MYHLIQDLFHLLLSNSFVLLLYWATIIEVANKGEGQNYWKVGDEIDLVLSGTFNETVTLQIWDFNHFDKTDGTGKANICFGMKNLMKNSQKLVSSQYNYSGWKDSEFRKNTVPRIYNSLPKEVKDHIKEVMTWSNSGGQTTSSTYVFDKIFLPGCTEMDLTHHTIPNGNYDGSQVKFPIFTDNNSRIKKMNNGSGSANSWYTRSPECDNSEYYIGVSWTGSIFFGYGDTTEGICFCFNL